MSDNSRICRCWRCFTLTDRWELRPASAERQYPIAVCAQCIKNIQISRLEEKEAHEGIQASID